MRKNLLGYCLVMALVLGGMALVPDLGRAENPALRGARTHLGEKGEKLEGYLVAPEGKGPFPGIVLVQEWWGLNDQIQGLADRLSAEGYVVVAPDLYHGKVATDPEKAHEIMRGMDQEEAIKELQQAIKFLRGLPEVSDSKIGSVGFCMGGGLSLRLALAAEDLSAAVMFYGRPVTDPAELKKAACPVLGFFGEEDQGIPREKVEAMASGLREADKQVDIHFYAGAGHAFFNETRSSYRPEAASDAWKRMMAFFKEELGK